MGPWRRDVCRIARPNTALASPTTMAVLRSRRDDGWDALDRRGGRTAVPARVPVVLGAEPAALYERSHEQQVLDLHDGPLLPVDRQPREVRSQVRRFGWVQAGHLQASVGAEDRSGLTGRRDRHGRAAFFACQHSVDLQSPGDPSALWVVPPNVRSGME